MAEVLVQFSSPVQTADGASYHARVCGREAEDGLWEGWIEFDPRDGSPVLRTPRETEQPDRDDLQYWATGLSVAYLEGALERARRPPRAVHRTIEAHPAYEGPAPRAILNPFAVYAQGENVLREELSALDPDQLRNIIRAYGLADGEEANLPALDRAALANMILVATRSRTV